MTIEEQVRKARLASRTLACLPRARTDEALELIAEALRRRAGEILAENARATFTELGLESHLTPQRSNGVRSMIERIRADAKAEL